MTKESIPVRYLIPALCILVPVVYWLLHLNYRFDNIDDAWTFAWAYEWWVNGALVDIVFKGGTEADLSNFAMLYRLLYGWAGSTFGWTKSAAHLTSIVLMTGAAVLWILSLRKLGFSRNFCLIFGLLFLLAEPIFSTANQARVDALSIFWIAGAVWMASHHSGLGVGLFTVLAFESHPAGAVHAGGFGIAILGYSIFTSFSGRPRWAALRKASLGLLAGAIIGGLLYFACYHDTLEHLTGTFGRKRQMDDYRFQNYLLTYFFITSYRFHVPEFLLLLFILIYGYWKKFFRHARLGTILLMVAILASVIISRPNFNYATFSYPVLLLLFLSFGAYFKKLGLMAVVLTLLFTWQYSWVYCQQGNYNFAEQTRRLQALVEDDKLPVFGTANDWFAFQDRDFRHLTVPRRGLPDIDRGFYLVRNSAEQHPMGRALRRLLRHFTLIRIDEFEINGREITVDKAIPLEAGLPATGNHQLGRLHPPIHKYDDIIFSLATYPAGLRHPGFPDCPADKYCLFGLPEERLGGQGVHHPQAAADLAGQVHYDHRECWEVVLFDTVEVPVAQDQDGRVFPGPDGGDYGLDIDQFHLAEAVAFLEQRQADRRLLGILGVLLPDLGRTFPDHIETATAFAFPDDLGSFGEPFPG